MLTTCPRALSRCGNAVCVQRTAPSRFRSISSPKSSADVRASSPRGERPALFTSASIRPNRSTVAAIIASKSAATVKAGKRAFYEQREMGLKTAYDHASAVMVENMLARDAEEGIGAFMEKRQPDWRHG